MGYPIIFKQLDYFLVQQLTRKLAAVQKTKKVKILATPSQFFPNISQTTKARQLWFLPISVF
jgi:hypothetical protein